MISTVYRLLCFLLSAVFVFLLTTDYGFSYCLLPREGFAMSRPPLTLTPGPLGFPVTDEQARALEGILQTHSKDSAFAYRQLVLAKGQAEVLPGERSDVSWITSLGQAADWQHIEALRDMRDWMTHYPGGGYPTKVTEFIKKKCHEAHVEEPEYVQVESMDMDILKLATRNGWMPCITYGISPTGRYGGKSIAHMVNLVHAEGNEFAVLDNNFPGTFEWMNEAEFSRSYKQGRGKGWAVIFYAPGPPPAPRN
jgi:hypothetical protein